MALQRYWQPQFSNAGFIRKRQRRYAGYLIEQWMQAAREVTIARNMSGGNQQKAIVARERYEHRLVCGAPSEALTWVQ